MPAASAHALRLYCFPYAGASAVSIYGRWRRCVPSWLELVPVELPGRGARIAQALQTDIGGLADQLATELADELPDAYAFFGHSLGALLAFEVARRVQGRTGNGPRKVIVSGANAPTARDGEVYARLRSDEDVLGYVRGLNGMSAEVLANAELLDLMLPIIKADLRLCASYRPVPQPRLDCPLHAFGGWQDRDVEVAALQAWRHETTGEFAMQMFEGDHFFIHSAQQAVVDRIAGLLSGCASERVALRA